MRLIAHSDHSSRYHFVRPYIAPCLGLCGLILSGIPLWMSILGGCVILGWTRISILKNWHLTFTPLPSLKNKTPLIDEARSIEINDGDLLRELKAGRVHLCKLRPGGWAGVWGVKLAISGKTLKTLYLSTSDYPPVLLRTFIRQRIHRKTDEEDRDHFVQTPAKPRLWL